MTDGVDALRAEHPWPDPLPPVEPRLWGWFREEHERVLGPRLSPSTQVVVELGSWLGMSTQFLLRAAPSATVIAIDHWRGSPEHHEREDWAAVLPTLYETFLVNCAAWSDRLVPLRLSTLEGIAAVAAAGVVPDLVYVDAGHDTDEVLADLRAVHAAWPTAVIVGDDWRWDTVRAAASRFAAETGRVPLVDGTAWTVEPVAFGTLAVSADYRSRALLLAADLATALPGATLVVATDDVADFAHLENVRTVAVTPTGPVAADYTPAMRLGGAGAYHDKRFALEAALELAPTAVLVDADSRLHGPVVVPALAPGLAVAHGTPESVLSHLLWAGVRRLPAFIGLARHLGDESLLSRGLWCQESCLAVRRDDRSADFVAAWGAAAGYLQGRGLFSGEGGVIGIAAALVGWEPSFTALDVLGESVQHERGGVRDGARG